MDGGQHGAGAVSVWPERRSLGRRFPRADRVYTAGPALCGAGFLLSLIHILPQNASRADYQAATGLEALFGWLWLQGRTERLNQLFACLLYTSLRSGTATCVSDTSPGLVDMTAGTTLAGGGALTANHLYLATIEGRGVKASTAVTLLVRGTYSIQ